MNNDNEINSKTPKEWRKLLFQGAGSDKSSISKLVLGKKENLKYVFSDMPENFTADVLEFYSILKKVEEEYTKYILDISGDFSQMNIEEMMKQLNIRQELNETALKSLRQYENKIKETYFSMLGLENNSINNKKFNAFLKKFNESVEDIVGILFPNHLIFIETYSVMFEKIFLPLITLKFEEHLKFKKIKDLDILKLYIGYFVDGDDELKKRFSILSEMIANGGEFCEKLLDLKSKDFLPALSFVEILNPKHNLTVEEKQSAFDKLVSIIPSFYKDRQKNELLASLISRCGDTDKVDKILELIGKVFSITKNTSNKKEYDKTKQLVVIKQLNFIIKECGINSVLDIDIESVNSMAVKVFEDVSSRILKKDNSLSIENVISKFNSSSDFWTFATSVQFTNNFLVNEQVHDFVSDSDSDNDTDNHSDTDNDSDSDDDEIFISNFEKASASFSNLLDVMLSGDMKKYKELRYGNLNSVTDDMKSLWCADAPTHIINDGMKITLSDNPYELIMSANNKINDSCLVINNDNKNQLLLWGMILDGRSKMIVLKNNLNEIIGRSIVMVKLNRTHL